MGWNGLFLAAGAESLTSECPNSSGLPWISQDILLHEQIWHLLGSAAAAYAALQRIDTVKHLMDEIKAEDKIEGEEVKDIINQMTQILKGDTNHNRSNTNCSSEERLWRLWSLEEISVSQVGLAIAREPIHAVVWHELARIYMGVTDNAHTVARLFWEDTYKLCAPFGYTARLRSLYHCLHGAGHAAWRIAGHVARKTWDWRFCEPYRVGVLPSGPAVHDHAVNPNDHAEQFLILICCPTGRLQYARLLVLHRQGIYAQQESTWTCFTYAF